MANVQHKKDSILLRAFEGTNETVPVWFMRQAGRYLPAYRRLRERYSLEDMFQTPDLAADITLMPITDIGVDAAILFADILTLPKAMGFDIRFDNQKGPLVASLEKGAAPRDFADLSYVAAIIKQVTARLPEHVPLIGFAGSPFTVLTYLIEGGSAVSYHKTLKFMQAEPTRYHALMELLTDNTIRYLQLQQEAGIDCFQLFDTWGGILRPADFARYVLPYVQKIFEQVTLPSIYYLKNCHHLLALMNQSGADILSVCHTVVLGHHTVIEHTKKGIQGNLYNGLLYASPDILRKEVHDVLVGGAKHQRYIFNLNHGIYPDVDPDQLKRVVDQVHQFSLSQ